MKRSTLAALGVIGLSAAVGLEVYPEMSERMAIHWDASGTADGDASRTVGLLLLPALSMLILGIFEAIPRIDPLGDNIERFRGYYDGFLLAALLFLLYVHLLVIAANLGYDFDLTRALLPAVGVLFYAAGVVMGAPSETGSSASGRRGRSRATRSGTGRTDSVPACSSSRA